MMIDAVRRCSAAISTPWRPNSPPIPMMPPCGRSRPAHRTAPARSRCISRAISATSSAPRWEDTGYVRDREREFSTRDVPREELFTLITTTRTEVDATLAALDPAFVDVPYPLPLPFSDPTQGQAIPTGRFLVHLAIHLGYHLGQVDFHRRLSTGNGASVGALGLTALF